MAPGSFFPASAPAGAGKIILSPVQYALDGTDALRVVCANSAPGVVVTIAGYRIDETGHKHGFVFTMTPSPDRVVADRDFPLGAGVLLNLTAYASSGSPLVGQTFLVVHLVRGFTGATVIVGTLLSGYVTATQALPWPGSLLQRSTDGEPPIRQFAGTAPAVNTDWSQSVPTGARWQIMSVFALLTAGVVGTPRTVGLVLGGDVGSLAAVDPAATQPDTVTRQYTWAPNLPFSAQANTAFIQQPIPQPTILRAGWTIASFTFGIGGGDQWSTPLFNVREWLEVL